MSKSFKKLMTIILSITVTLAFSSITAFAYTPVDDDGDRSNVNDSSYHIVYGTTGMLRIMDEGTSVTVNDDDTVTVTAKTSSSKTWGKITKLAFIEQSATDAEKDAAAEEVKFDENKYYADTEVSRTLTFTIPVSDLGKKIPVCRYVSSSDSEGKWTDFSTQQYYIVEKSAIPTELAMENNVGMFKPESVSISGTEGAYTLHLVMQNMNLTKIFVGYASDATDENAIAITEKDGKGYVDVPVASVNEPIVLAFLGSKWYNRTLTIDLEEKTAVYDPTQVSFERFDSLTLEEAIEKAKTDTSVDTVNALIEAIQVQQRYDTTDKYCAIAKAYYDALSDKDKEKLDDPGYFGDDTGDASKDDPLNTAPDKEKELLVVSFGTSFNDSRVATISAIEKALDKAYGSEYAVRRAFTAQIIINHVQARDGEKIDNVDQAMEKAVAAGVKEMIVQPTHLMSGAEYDELKGQIDKYADKIEITYAKPLLNSEADKEKVAKAVVAETAKTAGFESAAAAAEAKTAFVFMGHGTSHEANVTYTQMQKTMDNLGFDNCFVGTVEGKPAETALPEIKKAVEKKGYTKVILRPLMVVAGDHANNDMAADEEGSWYYAFVNGGEFEVEGQDEAVDIGAGFGKENVGKQVFGLGEIAEIQDMYVAHSKAAMDEKADADAKKAADAAKKAKADKIKAAKAVKVTIKTPAKAKKAFTAKWKNVKKVTGYQVAYSLKKNFKKGVKYKKVKGAAKKSLKIKKLKAKKTYYVKVRAYTVIDGKTYYGKWSKVKKVKTKK